MRRTTLAQDEYHKHFHKIDEEVIGAITSREADAVTPLMSKIYLRLVNAPREFWEQKRVLHFTSRSTEGKLVKASTVLCEYLGVARATVSKALRWMHDTGVIGYFAGKNGVGIRIFLNHATSSIGTKPQPAGQKILSFSAGSSGARDGSTDEPPFNDPFGSSEFSDTDLNPHAPKNGAKANPTDKKFSRSAQALTATSPANTRLKLGALAGTDPAAAAAPAATTPVESIVRRLRSELEPLLKTAAFEAAQREHERTREWLDRHGIPKASRVAQKEAYNVLRSHGLVNGERERVRAELDVGRSAVSRVERTSQQSAGYQPLKPERIAEIAESCVALFELQGKAVDETISKMGAGTGGWLLADDLPKVREAAHALLRGRGASI